MTDVSLAREQQRAAHAERHVSARSASQRARPTTLAALPGLAAIALLVVSRVPTAAQPISAPPMAQTVSVTVLSTMLTDTVGIGEWGFAAVVDVDGRRWLFDTGARPETVLRNAEELRVDLASITDVVLSHHHGDHTGGLLTLRKTLMAKNSAALGTAHVADGIFRPRRGRGDAETNPMVALRQSYEATGGRFVEHRGESSLQPGVFLTGPVPRVHPERNWSGQSRILEASGLVDDTLPEDQAMVIATARGLTIVTGCGHAGIGNILAYARKQHQGSTVRAVIGGLHLFNADETQLTWTAERMREAGVTHLLGAHCTGIEAVYRLRALTGLSRETAVIGAVGGGYDDAKGLRPGLLAR